MTNSTGPPLNVTRTALVNSHTNQPTNVLPTSHSNPLALGHQSGSYLSFGSAGDPARPGDGDAGRTPGGLWNQSTTEAEQNELLRWLLEEPAAQTTLFDFNFDVG